MKFDVKIDCMALFNECMDQTLIDYRNRTTETGQSIAATHTLDRSLLDTFYVNLHSVSKALRTALRKQVCEVLFIPDLLQYRVYLDPGIPPESIAVEVKDALKYGMLCWWYGGRAVPTLPLLIRNHSRKAARPDTQYPYRKTLPHIMITRENKLFRLSWLKSNLFRATSTETAYNARMLENETGQDMFDRYAMTIDERPFFDEHIAQALLALLHHFRRIVPDCQPITTEGDACGLTFAARVSRDEDEFYSHAELQGVERSATEILRYYILAEWYLSIRANDLWTAYTQKLTAAVATLSSYLFRFYRPVLRRAHRVSPCPEEYSQHGEIQIIDAGLV